MGHMRSRRPHESNFSFHLYLIFSMFINLYISIYRYKIDGVGFVEEIIKNRGEKRDNTYAEEIELFYSNSNCSQQRYDK